MTLTGTNTIVLWNPSASQSAGIVLNPNPAGSSTFSGSIIVNGTNNQLPNQSVIGSASIVTKGYADTAYAPIGAGILSSTNGGAVNTSWNGGSITTQGATYRRGYYVDDENWNPVFVATSSREIAGGSINLSSYGGGQVYNDNVGDWDQVGAGGSISMVGGLYGNAGSIDLSAGNGYGSAGGGIRLKGGSYNNAWGGSIDLSAGDGDGARGGSISMKGSNHYNGSGGSVSMNGGQETRGGSVSMNGGTGIEAHGGSVEANGGSQFFAYGGTLNMSGGTYSGGFINTSNGGASLLTRNTTVGQALVAQADGTENGTGRQLYTYKPTTIPLLTANQTYTGANTFSGSVHVAPQGDLSMGTFTTSSTVQGQ